eukprot:SAG31_NODE_27270_length_429_cov_0.409091_1_plen_83_part_10
MPHPHQDDWIDAVATILIDYPRPRHDTVGIDFGMNYAKVHGEQLKQEWWEAEGISIHMLLRYTEWPTNWSLRTKSGKARTWRR